MQSTDIKFQRQDRNGFYKVLRQRVNEYFKENNLSKNANGTMIGKTVFVLSGFVISYALIISGLLAPWMMLVLAMVNGLFTAFIGLNIAHDAIHGAYSSNQQTNKIIGSIFNVMGANDYNWSISHNIVHHTYTNIPDHDGDIEQVPIIRMNPKQKLWRMHRFQHLYVFLLYPLSSLSWVFLKDYKMWFSKKIGGYENSQKPKKEFFRMILYKAFYYTIMLVIPLLVIDLAWYWIIFGFLMLHLVEGLSLSIIFQLAHVVEETNFPQPDEKGMIGNSWSEHQMYTTANFATRNPVVNYLFGGLNFQIEHHLFPKICHVHYKNLQPIVRQTAKEHGLPYYDHPTLFGAINSHIRTLKQFGTQQDPKLVPAHA